MPVQEGLRVEWRHTGYGTEFLVYPTWSVKPYHVDVDAVRVEVYDLGGGQTRVRVWWAIIPKLSFDDIASYGTALAVAARLAKEIEGAGMNQVIARLTMGRSVAE